MPGAKGPHPNRVASEVEEAILAHALAHSAHGGQRLAGDLMLRGVQVSSRGVSGVWIRNGLQKRVEWLLRPEKSVRKRDFELTEEQILALERFDPEYRARHIEAKRTGKLVAVDTFLRGHVEEGGEGLNPDRAGLLQPRRVGPGAHFEDAGDRRPDLQQPRAPLPRGARREGQDGPERQRSRVLRSGGPRFLQLEEIEHREDEGGRPSASQTASSSASTVPS